MAILKDKKLLLSVTVTVYRDQQSQNALRQLAEM